MNGKLPLHDSGPTGPCSRVGLDGFVMFLNFRTPTNFTVNTLKFKLRGSTMV